MANLKKLLTAINVYLRKFSFFLQPSDSLRPSLFQTCLASEELPTRLESYRDKLVCLQKIRFSSAFYDDLADLYRDAAVLYLCGMLCVNFSPLWDPVIDIVASFARGSNVKNFWRIFSELLNTTSDKTGACLTYSVEL